MPTLCKKYNFLFFKPAKADPLFAAVDDPKPAIATIRTEIKVITVIAENIADSHPNTKPPVSSVRQNKNFGTVGKEIPILKEKTKTFSTLTLTIAE